VKKKNEKTTLPPDNAEQSRRFVETARKLDADESGRKFAKAFKKVVPKKRIRPSGSGDS
jgi:hypothetical protein